MQDQRNLVLAIIASVAILLFFEVFVEGPRRERLREEMARSQPTQSPAATASQPAKPAPVGDARALASNLLMPRHEALLESPRIRIESPRVQGSLSLAGARLDDLKLRQYRVSVEPFSPSIVLLSPTGGPDPYYGEFGWTAPAGANVKLPGRDTVWQADRQELRPGQPVTLTWNNGEGLRFRQVIDLDADYLFTVTQMVDNSGERAVTLFPFGLISRHGTPSTFGFYILHEGPLGVLREKKEDAGTLTEISYSDVADSKTIEQKSVGGWIGITDKYWLAAIVPPLDANVTAAFRYSPGTPERYQIDILGDGLEVPARGSASFASRFYAGAKEVHVLERYEAQDRILRFDLAIDWGWLYFLTRPIFFALDYFKRLLGNFGLAILLFTVIIKILFLPLVNKSYVSMSAMKQVQPEMMRLRELHGDDRQRLNQELMALYKREKINPAAGCLPIVLQIPVFFALYKVLFVTIEMRHAPFYGWIRDLSAADPTTWLNLFGLLPWSRPDLGPLDLLNVGLWPLLMGISMWVQMRLNPQPPDPIQARLFMLMPIVFTFMLAPFAVGLVIYWTWNNLLTIAQQWLIMKRTAARKTT